MERKTEAAGVFPDGRMNVKAAADYVGLAVATLAIHRCNGTGPRFIKKGRIWYYRQDLDDWLNADGRHTSTASARPVQAA